MKKYLLLIVLLFTIILKTEAQKTSIETWDRILKTANVDWEEIYKVCPNFPERETNAELFSSKLNSWSISFENEMKSFYAIDKIKKINPSPYYLGLPLEEIKDTDYDNSFIQWIKESKISDRRMMELAPHFPNLDFDVENLDFELSRWKDLYGHEYENVINAKELIALNPFYTEYIDVSQLPHFLGGLESKEKPVFKENLSKEEQLFFELKLMNWYFVFEPENFRKEYGFFPEFPDFFNENKYRSSIIWKIEETERQKKLGNFESN